MRGTACSTNDELSPRKNCKGFKKPSIVTSVDARFLQLHSAGLLVQQMGAPEDDGLNTFTVRMLLLLESKPLLGSSVHQQLVSTCLDAYWKNLAGHEASYLPIVLVNDIIRYWRILLLNYEAKTEKDREKARLGTDELDADRRLRTCKLRFSRCLMCYASIVDMLGEAHATQLAHGTACIERRAVDEMVKRTPLDRLRSGLEKARDLDAAQTSGRRLLELYALFLGQMDCSKQDQLALFADVARRGTLMRAATEFGQVMFELLGVLGSRNPLYRYVVL